MRLTFALALAGLLVPAAAHACCTASRPGVHVQIADQEVLVAWDAETKTEHFVRQASFESPEPGFGFLVPTPTEPTLAEADAEVFDRLRKAIEPEVITKTRTRIVPTSLCLFPLSMGRAAKSAPTAAALDARAVEVLQRTQVAGYDAAVLAASDADALGEWLRKNEFASRPELIEWARPYVKAGWKVTAFKYRTQTDELEGPRVGTSAIRMSFKTDAPLFPYRVPKDQHARAHNLLRLYFVSDQRYAASFSLDGLRRGAPWKAEVPFSATSQALAGLLTGAVPEPSAAGQWLTTFEDRAWPGGSEDLYFAPSDAGEVRPEPVVNYRDKNIPLPLEVFVLALAGGAWWWKKRSAGPPA